MRKDTKLPNGWVKREYENTQIGTIYLRPPEGAPDADDAGSTIVLSEKEEAAHGAGWYAGVNCFFTVSNVGPFKTRKEAMRFAENPEFMTIMRLRQAEAAKQYEAKFRYPRKVIQKTAKKAFYRGHR